YRSINGAFSLDTIAADTLKPNRPVVSYTGASNFPINRLTFRSSTFSGIGANTFASMKWRIAEVTDTNNPTFDPGEPWNYEITALWESPEISAFNSDVTIPPDG